MADAEVSHGGSGGKTPPKTEEVPTITLASYAVDTPRAGPGSGQTPYGPETYPRLLNGQREKFAGNEKAIPTDLAGRLGRNVEQELKKMMREHAGMTDVAFQRRYRDSGHAYMLDLYEQFTAPQPGADGRNRQFKAEEFDNYLSTNEGADEAYMVTRRLYQDLLAASGSEQHMNPDRPAGAMIAEGDVTIGEQGRGRYAVREVKNWFGRGNPDYQYAPRGTGVLGRIANAATQNNLRSSILGTGRRIGATVGGSTALLFGSVAAATGSPTVAAVGAGALAVEAAYAGIQRTLRPGERLETRHSAAAQIAAVGDPLSLDPSRTSANQAEVDYFQNHLLVDPFDQVIPNNPYTTDRSELTINHRPESSGTRIDDEELRTIIDGYANDILDYQTWKGIPERQRDPNPIRFLLDGTQIPPKHGTEIEQLVLNRFTKHAPGEPQRGIFDLNNNPFEFYDPLTGTSTRNPAFDVNNPDIARNIAGYNRAYTEIMAVNMGQSFQRAKDRGANYPDAFNERLRKRKEATGPTSEAARLAREAITRRRENITAAQTEVTTTQANFSDYDKQVKEQQRILDQKETARGELEARIEVFDPSGATTGLPSVRDALRGVLTQDGYTYEVRIDGDPIRALKDEQERVDRAVEGVYGPWYRRDIEPELTILRTAMAAAKDEDKSAIARQMAELSTSAREYKKELVNDLGGEYLKRKKLAQGTREALKKIDEEVKTARETLTNRFDDKRRPAEQKVRDMQTWRRNLIDWSTNPAVAAAITAGTVAPIDNNALATLGIEELQARINQINGIAATAGVGWPEGENDNPTNRNHLILAMAEARAAVLDPRIVTPSADFQAATTLYGFRELDVMALSTQELQRLSRGRRHPITGRVLPIPRSTIIEAVKAEASARFRARERGLPQMTTMLTESTRLIGLESARIEREGVPSARLQVFEKAGERVADDKGDKILETITALPDAEVVRLLDPTVITTQPGYNAQEVGQTIAEVTLRRWLFDTVNDTTAEYTTGGVTINRGQEAAAARARDTITTAIFNAELARMGAELRLQPGLDVTTLQTAFRTGTLSKIQLADFLTNGMVMHHMGQLADVA